MLINSISVEFFFKNPLIFLKELNKSISKVWVVPYISSNFSINTLFYAFKTYMSSKGYTWTVFWTTTVFLYNEDKFLPLDNKLNPRNSLFYKINKHKNFNPLVNFQ